MRAIRAIHPGPKVMIPICVKLLEDPDPAIRGRILNAIAESGVEAVPALIEALKDEKAAFWALIILRDIGPAAKDAIPAITEKLKDKKPEIRREAVLTLGAFGEAAAPAVPQIAALLSDEHAGTAATFVLGELGQIPKDAEATVRANAKSNDQMLSTTSLWALARVHPEDKELRRETTEKLVARLKDKDPFVRVAAARALAALPPAPEITVPIWEKALQGCRRDHDASCHGCLGRSGGPGRAAIDRCLEAREVPRRDRLRLGPHRSRRRAGDGRTGQAGRRQELPRGPRGDHRPGQYRPRGEGRGAGLDQGPGAGRRQGHELRGDCFCLGQDRSGGRVRRVGVAQEVGEQGRQRAVAERLGAGPDRSGIGRYCGEGRAAC